MEDGQEKVLPYEGEVREKEQKDAELDKKIKALKKKNEALVQRHREKRIVRKGRRSSSSAEQKFTLLMGNEMKLSVSVDSNVEDMRNISKKIDQDVLFLTRKTSKLSVGAADDVFTFGQGPHMQIAISRQKESAMPKVERKKEKSRKKCKMEQDKEPGEKYERSFSDHPMTMSAMEHGEYLQWKKERQEVDTERLARQKNSKGEWRRTWDKGKTNEMFAVDTCCANTVPSLLSGRKGEWGRKMQSVIENKGDEKEIRNEKTLTLMNTMSSRAKGKDRLTGRAQRWYSIEHEDISYLPKEAPLQKSLHDEITVKHSEENFKEDGFLNTKKLKVPIQNTLLGNEEKIVFANEKLLLESKQDVPFHGKKLEVTSNDLISEGREMLEYLSVLGSDSDPGENSART
ncbi:coiled-coil domain-containing protein 9B isoform X2 [Ranitomeya imitator]|uniref:coiled-coil domain-containing protein 9B isoform X2 n=1 Tax=Ranitomeya imitator TaxID=111125 RepID=UPI0037E9B336